MSVTFSISPDGAPRSTSTIISNLDIKSPHEGLSVSAVNAETKLKAMLEISRNLGSVIALEQVCTKILDGLFKIFSQADRGFIVLQGEAEVLIPQAVKLRGSEPEDTIRISRDIVRKAMDGKQAILTPEAASDSRFDGSQSIADSRIRSIMCAPLLSTDDIAMGIIQIDTLDQRALFSQDDLDLLTCIAIPASIAVEKAQLHEAALRMTALERDSEQLADTGHVRVLQLKAPELYGYEFFHFCEQANQLRGDYFDYIVLPKKRLAIIVANVPGNGMPAALRMASLSAKAKSALVSDLGPAGALRNAVLTQAHPIDQYVTAAIAVLDLERHEVQFANIGQLPPFLRRRDGAIVAVGVEQASAPLGPQVTLNMAPGEAIVMFTHGIRQATNFSGDLYGLDRIVEQVKKPAESVKQLGARIRDDVKTFVGSRSQNDDLCLLCFGRMQ